MWTQTSWPSLALPGGDPSWLTRTFRVSAPSGWALAPPQSSPGSQGPQLENKPGQSSPHCTWPSARHSSGMLAPQLSTEARGSILGAAALCQGDLPQPPPQTCVCWGHMVPASPTLSFLQDTRPPSVRRWGGKVTQALAIGPGCALPQVATQPLDPPPRLSLLTASCNRHLHSDPGQRPSSCSLWDRASLCNNRPPGSCCVGTPPAPVREATGELLRGAGALHGVPPDL